MFRELASFTSFLKIWFPKYFEYTYGIDAPKHLKTLVEKGYALVETSFDSLDHLNTTMKKNILKKKGVTGLSKMKSCDLDQALHEHFSEEELAGHFHVLLWTFLQWHCYHTQYLSKRLVRKLYCSSSSKFPNC